MANFYWVGGSGNWNDSANHWSSSSGGAPGAGVPTSTDDCIFDASSFSAASRTVTFNVSPDVKSMDFSAIDENGLIVGTNSSTIRGNLTLKSGMSWSGAGSITFNTNATTCNFNPASVSLSLSGNVVVSSSGTFNLLGNLTMTSATFRPNGSATINTSGYSITTSAFQAQAGDTSTINLGASTITVSGSTNAFLIQSGSTLNAGTSTVVVSGSGGQFIGAGKTYNIVTFSGNNTLITGSNTFTTLNVNTAGLATGLRFTAGTTQTVTNFNTNGSSGSIAKILSSSGGSPFSLTTASSLISVDYMSITDSTAVETFTWYAGENSTDGGGNTNWIFDTPSPRQNTALGSEAGFSIVNSRGNVFLGYRAGYNELGSNKLYISNSSTSTPLIYGLFSGTGAGVIIYSQATNGIPLVVQGIASQTSNLQEWQSNTPTTLASVSPTGVFTAPNFVSNVAIGTQPYATTSTTLNTNLNADLLDSQSGAYYLDAANFTGTNWTDLTDGGSTTLHTHSIYFLKAGDTITDGGNISFGTVTGTKIGTATTQLLAFYNQTPVDQPAALTTQLTTITHTAPGVDDFAIQDLTQTTPFGFVTKDEGNTVLKVVANLQARLAEVEARLEELGLVAAN